MFENGSPKPPEGEGEEKKELNDSVKSKETGPVDETHEIGEKRVKAIVNAFAEPIQKMKENFKNIDLMHIAAEIAATPELAKQGAQEVGRYFMEEDIPQTLEDFKAMGKPFVDAGKNAYEYMKQDAKTTLEHFNTGRQFVADKAGEAGKFVVEKRDEAGKFVKEKFQEGKDYMDKEVKNTQEDFRKTLDLAKKLGGDVKRELSSEWDKTKDGWSKRASEVWGFATKIFNGAKSTVEWAGGIIANIVKESKKTIENIINSASEFIKEKAGKLRIKTKELQDRIDQIQKDIEQKKLAQAHQNSENVLKDLLAQKEKLLLAIKDAEEEKQTYEF